MHKISTCVLSSIGLKLKLTQTLNTGLEAPCSKYIFASIQYFFVLGHLHLVALTAGVFLRHTGVGVAAAVAEQLAAGTHEALVVRDDGAALDRVPTREQVRVGEVARLKLLLQVPVEGLVELPQVEHVAVLGGQVARAEIKNVSEDEEENQTHEHGH